MRGRTVGRLVGLAGPGAAATGYGMANAGREDPGRAVGVPGPEPGRAAPGDDDSPDDDGDDDD